MEDERPHWDLKNPSDVLDQLLRRSRASIGDVVVARVDLDSQRVTGTRKLRVPKEPRRKPSPWPDEEHRATYTSKLSTVVRGAAQALAPERVWQPDGRGGMTGVFITVVCREGRVVDTDAEWRWLYAWRYANHLRDGFDGDVYVVTPHGWTGVMDRRAGFSPAVGAGDGRPALRAL